MQVDGDRGSPDEGRSSIVASSGAASLTASEQRERILEAARHDEVGEVMRR